MLVGAGVATLMTVRGKALTKSKKIATENAKRPANAKVGTNQAVLLLTGGLDPAKIENLCGPIPTIPTQPTQDPNKLFPMDMIP